jgi:hypothetical protein
VVNLVTQLTMTSVERHKNSLTASGIYQKYYDPKETPNRSGYLVVDNLIKNINGFKACPTCRLRLLSMAQLMTITSEMQKRKAMDMLPEEAADQSDSEKEPNLNPDNKEHKQALDNMDNEAQGPDKQPMQLDKTSLTKLEQVRVDICYNLATLTKSIIAGCLWNVLNLTFNERRRRTLHQPQLDCAAPLPIKAEPLLKLESTAKSGLKPPKARSGRPRGDTEDSTPKDCT